MTNDIAEVCTFRRTAARSWMILLMRLGRSNLSICPKHLVRRREQEMALPEYLCVLASSYSDQQLIRPWPLQRVTLRGWDGYPHTRSATGRS
ncbi:hypothetical protein KCU62_g440, partial [Aureobasidium sp. EXF-3399]